MTLPCRHRFAARPHAPAWLLACALATAACGPSPSGALDAGSSDDARRGDAGGEVDPIARGAELFAHAFTPDEGLGPLYNARACVDCHGVPTPGGMGPGGLGTALLAGRLTASGFDPLSARGGPVARAHSVAELGFACGLAPGPPPEADVTSSRNAPDLYGMGRIDAIADGVILANAVAHEDGVHGVANMVTDPTGRPRVGRFGWKAQLGTLELFVGNAFRNELGVTNPIAPTDLLPPYPDGAARCAGDHAGLEDDGGRVRAVSAFLATLPAPPPASPTAPGSADGAVVFRQIGCASCHVPSLAGPDGDVPLYSDLLLHDMGPSLDDGVPQEHAAGRQWRTTPLWGLRARVRLLHDGRGSALRDAVVAHGGEADGAVRRFLALDPRDHDTLLAFLGSL